MMDEERILKTIQEARMTKKLLKSLEIKIESEGKDKGWLYPSEALSILSEFKSSAVRAFLDN